MAQKLRLCGAGPAARTCLAVNEAAKSPIWRFPFAIGLALLLVTAPGGAQAQAQAQTLSCDAALQAPRDAIADPGLADRLALGSLAEIAEALAEGRVTSHAMVRAYLRRIAALDRSGPMLGAVLAINPDALEEACQADAARARGEAPGLLQGIPILLKDNIETRGPLPTTAGSLALKDNVAERDADIVRRLRAQGAIILGKTNLSEWANFRSSRSVSGWSALGGITRNPHVLSRSPCGSSSGSGASTAAALAAAAVGTETNGSIICPASVNGVVGFKPTVGLLSQEGIVPIALSFDTAGPMTRSVRDAAILLTAMASGEGARDFTRALDASFLRGRRIGVMRFAVGGNRDVAALFDAALTTLEAQGAVLVEIEQFAPSDGFREASRRVAQAEFRHGLDRYLAGTDSAKVAVRSLADLVRFNEETPGEALSLFDQARLQAALAGHSIDDPDYAEALALVRRATRHEGIDRMLAQHRVELLVAPSRGPAPLIDMIYGDQSHGDIGAGYLAALSGYPNLTVPMGKVHGLPIGIDFMSGAGRDADVLAAGYAFEQAAPRPTSPTYLDSEMSGPSLREAVHGASGADAAIAADEGAMRPLLDD